jgi:hypothetical protein
MWEGFLDKTSEQGRSSVTLRASRSTHRLFRPRQALIGAIPPAPLDHYNQQKYPTPTAHWLGGWAGVRERDITCNVTHYRSPQASTTTSIQGTRHRTANLSCLNIALPWPLLSQKFMENRLDDALSSVIQGSETLGHMVPCSFPDDLGEAVLCIIYHENEFGAPSPASVFLCSSNIFRKSQSFDCQNTPIPRRQPYPVSCRAGAWHRNIRGHGSRYFRAILTFVCE